MQNVEKSYCTFEWVEGLVKRLADSTFGREGKCDSFFYFPSRVSPTAVYEAVLGNNLFCKYRKSKNKYSIYNVRKDCGITLSGFRYNTEQTLQTKQV